MLLEDEVVHPEHPGQVLVVLPKTVRLLHSTTHVVVPSSGFDMSARNVPFRRWI
jgi:hypothetical protein